MKANWIIGGALLAALLQSAALGKILWDRHSLLENGQEVVLQSAMVDPRDLFRGHYVRLNLSVGALEEGTFTVDGELKRGEDVFVSLKPGEDGFWVARTLHAAMPQAPSAPILRGKLISDRPVTGDNAPRYVIRFPFDRYFADRKKAKDLEKVRNDRKLGVIISVGEDGEGAVKGISVDGELVYVERVF
ncbi:GDYXXLXY domain-containing protein [Salaquimonas pukyongi]|uniref:GDYXXLXY domain-containing protein n=1 Tax=Salaquimonas pukyongi TaxID=2712698 RepID=UPI00096B7340|nr:GDYXXLXY domain-containing protein [Salaquimonas pukyongi]